LPDFYWSIVTFNFGYPSEQNYRFGENQTQGVTPEYDMHTTAAYLQSDRK